MLQQLFFLRSNFYLGVCARVIRSVLHIITRSGAKIIMLLHISSQGMSTTFFRLKLPQCTLEKSYHYVVYTNKAADYLEKQNKRQYKRGEKRLKKKRKKMVYLSHGRVIVEV